MLKIFVVFIFAPIWVPCQSRVSTDPYTYPDSTWKYVENPVDHGWSGDSLNKLRLFIVDSTQATGVVVIQSGKVL
jgi:hypothetical protein